MSGRPLAEHIDPDGVDIDRAARLTRELAEALAYAHGEGVVHRDVKPANVMLDAADRVYLLDFGLAARADEASRLTTDGAVIGTPAYMAPEQVTHFRDVRPRPTSTRRGDAVPPPHGRLSARPAGPDLRPAHPHRQDRPRHDP